MERLFFFKFLCISLSVLILLVSGITDQVSAQTLYEIKGIVKDSLTNEFENSQKVWSFYNAWGLNTGNWSFKTGVRLENTRLDADFISSSYRVDQNYLNLLAQTSMTLKFKNKSSLGFSISQRIQRPGIWDLNSFVDRSNPLMERSGTPDLEPVVGNNFQLNYNRSKSQQLASD